MNPDQRMSAAIADYERNPADNDELHDELVNLLKDAKRRLGIAMTNAHVLKHTQGAVTRPDCRKHVDRLYRAVDLREEFML